MAGLDLGTCWTLLPTQEKFLQAIRECPVNESRAVAYVGAVGSGKSWALCRAAIGLALAYPKIRILLGRHLSTDLRDSTEQTFFELITDLDDKIRQQYPPEYQDTVPSVGEFHKADRDYVFQNGSVILFRPLDEAERKYKSLNISAVGIDEADQVTEAAVQMLLARRRVKGYPLLFFIVSNPTGYTHWLYRWFVKDKQANYYLFRTNSFENAAHLPSGYIQEMSRKFSPDWIKRYIEGEWGGLTEGVPVFAGLFDEHIHIKPGMYFKGNPVWVGIDFGYQTPGVVWAHPDRENRCQVVREWLPHALDTYDLCQGILKRNGVYFPGAQFQYFCGQDGTTHSSQSDRTDVDILAEHGMLPNYRHHYLEAAFTVIRNMLKVREDGRPNLTFDPSADICIEAMMGAYRYKPPNRKGEISETRPKPLKDDIHDPAMDAFRYIAYQNYTLAGETHRGDARIRLTDIEETDEIEHPPTRRIGMTSGWSRREAPLRGQLRIG